MKDAFQDRVSRRKLMAAAVAAPVAGPHVRGASAQPIAKNAAPDPLIARAAEWIAANDRLDALSVEADDLQGHVFDKARALGIRGDVACRSNMPEARAMRMMKRDLVDGYRDLEQLAGDIREMRAISVAGALAKIQLGLKVQGEFDWREHALELAEDGIAELRQLTADQVETH